jgi:hypothetical protein
MASDEWKEDLRCPECGKTGVASLSQGEDADMPTIHIVPDGFKIVTTQYGPDFYCVTCDIEVAP